MAKNKSANEDISNTQQRFDDFEKRLSSFENKSQDYIKIANYTALVNNLFLSASKETQTIFSISTGAIALLVALLKFGEHDKIPSLYFATMVLFVISILICFITWNQNKKYLNLIIQREKSNGKEKKTDKLKEQIAIMGYKIQCKKKVLQFFDRSLIFVFSIAIIMGIIATYNL
jgi:hypothetical protein